MSRITFVNRFYWPDESATSQLLTDLASDLAGQGHEVCVITSRLRHDDSASPLPARGLERGVSIHRVRTTRFGRGRLAGRALDYLSFYLTACWAMLTRPRRGDTMVVMTDPPLLSVPAVAIARLKGVRVIAWLQDLYPEVAAALGVMSPAARPFRWLRALRNASLRHCARVVVIGERMKSCLVREGIDEDRMTVIPNWADGEAIRPLAAEDNPLRREWGLADAFVVGYSGNLGRAHDFGALMAAARVLADSPAGPGDAAPDIRFAIIGGGHQFGRLREAAAADNLGNLSFHPFQPRARLQQSLGLADIHVVSLKPDLEGYILPSKLYGILAAGRPVLYIGDPQAEVAALLRRHGIGAAFAPDDTRGLVDCILEYAASPERSRLEGARARQLFVTTFDRSHAVTRWAKQF